MSPAQANAALRRYTSTSQTTALRPSCAIPALDTEIAMQRDVIVALERSTDGQFGVRWRPADGGMFPRFSGTLDVLSLDGAAMLRLIGSYDDPSSLRAEKTDATLGVRLAHATARAMLEHLRIELERSTAQMRFPIG